MATTLFFSGFVVYNYVTGILKEQSIKENTIKLSQISQQLERMQEQINKTAEYIITDETIGSLTKKNQNEMITQEYFNRSDVNEVLRRIILLNDFVCNAVIVRSDGSIFSENKGYEEYYAEKIKDPWYLDFNIKNVKNGLSQVHDTFIAQKEEKVISYIIRYKNIQDGFSSQNTLILDIKYSIIETIFAKSTSDFEKLFLLDTDNTIVYGNSVSGEAFDPNTVVTALSGSANFIENNNSIITANFNPNNGWKEIAIISKSKLFGKIKILFIYFIIIIFCGMIFTLLVMLPIVFNITNPLSRLTKAMKKVSDGNLDISIEIKSGDEMQLLGEGFNKMIAELKENMRASIYHEKMLRKMQVDLLISQINPHFIYNTLNSVIYLTHEGRNLDAIIITKSLISILQDTVNTGDKAIFATIREELDVIEQYLNIQRYRYPDKFETELTVEDEIMGVTIPRMIIQPVVENALFHGISLSDRLGVLKINIFKKNNEIVIQIEDNGGCLSNTNKEKLLSYFYNMNKNEELKSLKIGGMGLRNVYLRLQLLYNECAIFTIDNSQKGRTIFTIGGPIYLNKEDFYEHHTQI